jgi:hypothetical protein
MNERRAHLYKQDICGLSNKHGLNPFRFEKILDAWLVEVDLGVCLKQGGRAQTRGLAYALRFLLSLLRLWQNDGLKSSEVLCVRV